MLSSNIEVIVDLTVLFDVEIKRLNFMFRYFVFVDTVCFKDAFLRVEVENYYFTVYSSVVNAS